MHAEDHEELYRRVKRWQKDLQRTTFYHLTHRANLPSIERLGLLPSRPGLSKHGLGQRSFEDVQGHIFLARAKKEALRQLYINRVMLLHAPYRRDMVMLRVRLPEGYQLDADDSNFMYTDEPIPPEYLEVVAH